MNTIAAKKPLSGLGNWSSPEELTEALLAGNRRALARAITLIESTRADHRAIADSILSQSLEQKPKSIRLGITGIPGVGKSSFIETFGLHVIGEGHKVAVLAVDPSSPRSGGSILGDKTRMEQLSRAPEAFIRPSPSGCSLGGVARRTREAMLLCEAAGFDVIIVETVGVGQSETAVADLVDMFLLLLAPGGGDELQGIKKGIVELADLVIVNKADGDLAPAAERARHEYANALHLLRPASDQWSPKVLKCSAHQGDGIDKVWQSIGKYEDIMGPSGKIAERRANQAQAWMWNEINETVMDHLKSDSDIQGMLAGLEQKVAEGTVTPAQAAKQILGNFLQSG